MSMPRGQKQRYRISEDVVAREIHGEFIVVPVTSVIEADEDALFSLNGTARVIWERLDGKKTIDDIARDLLKDYNASLEEITDNVQGFTRELLKRKMIVEVKK